MTTPLKEADWNAPEHGRKQILLDSLLPLNTLYEMGRERALSSGADKPAPHDEMTLSEAALTVARDTRMENYDPVNNPSDGLREDRHKESVASAPDARNAAGYAADRVTAREEELAAIKKNVTEPKMSAWIIVFAVLALSMTFGPTIHDRFLYALPSAMDAWGYSVLAGALLAAFITWAQLSSISTAGKRTALNMIGLGAGVCIGIAAGVLRLSDSSGWREYLFSGGLTLLEISIVVYLEWLATGLRAANEEWNTYQAKLAEAVERLNAAMQDHARRLAFAQEVEERIQQHIRYVESRWVRHSKHQDIEEAAVKAVLNGYAAGIAENKGRLLGLARRA